LQANIIDKLRLKSTEYLELLIKYPLNKGDRVKVCLQTSWACPEEREDGFEF